MPDSLLPKPFSLQEAKLKNPLALAYLGDTVWDLLIRQRLLAGGLPAGALHRRAILLANAGAQAEAAARIESALSPEEADVMRQMCIRDRFPPDAPAHVCAPTGSGAAGKTG